MMPCQWERCLKDPKTKEKVTEGGGSNGEISNFCDAYLTFSQV